MLGRFSRPFAMDKVWVQRGMYVTKVCDFKRLQYIHTTCIYIHFPSTTSQPMWYANHAYHRHITIRMHSKSRLNCIKCQIKHPLFLSPTVQSTCHHLVGSMGPSIQHKYSYMIKEKDKCQVHKFYIYFNLHEIGV